MRTVDVNLRCKAGVANERLGVGEVLVKELCLHHAFDVGGETLVEPEILPVVGGDLVACPLLRDSSHKHVFLTLITDDSCL